MSELAEKSPGGLQEYFDNPAKVMREAGLSDEQRETLLSNDVERIRDAIQNEYPEAEAVRAFIVILVPPKRPAGG